LQKFCILDYETYSECDLKKSGVFEYATHPSTEILCSSFMLGTRSELKTSPVLRNFDALTFRRLLKENYIFVAHNVMFEYMITLHQLKVEIPISRWICTASLARAASFPGSLELAAEALLGSRKDMDGRRLMLKLSKPSKNRPALIGASPTETSRLWEYCDQDVRVERDLFLALPPLTDFERRVWELDQKINRRGVRVDTELVKAAITLDEKLQKEVKAETKRLTNGRLDSPSQNLALADELGMPSVSKQALAAVDETKLSPVHKRLIELRRLGSKSSIAKYRALAARVKNSGVLRDFLVYSGAGTGRWSGSGVQIQNLPRGEKFEMNAAVEAIKTLDLGELDLIYGSVPKLLSSCIRGAFIPREGHRLYVGDYATIEVRVLFWLAGHERGLDIFRRSEDPYKTMASSIYKKKVADITSDERALGKATVLGCGFGMGPDKFKVTAENQGVVISEELAKRAVITYRETHSPVPLFWREIEKTAIRAMLNRGTEIKCGKLTWCFTGRHLSARLPSGRKMIYPFAKVEEIENRWGSIQPQLSFMALDPVYKKWARVTTYGGSLTENVVQAVARDIMASNLICLDAAGFNILFHVHDEVVCEKFNHPGNLELFSESLADVPEWASGLPIKVETWEGDRYRK
jgi:DNA polymerase